MRPPHSHNHAFATYYPREAEGLCVMTRRNLLKASMAGFAGLSLPGLLRQRAIGGMSGAGPKSIILLWMTGGPSQIDTWDPKPDRPLQNRGPFGTIATRLPGVRICEHLPLQAAMLDRFTIIRSVDSRTSNHEPSTTFQTGYRNADPRTNPEAVMYPAIGSVVAKMRGPNHPAMPPYVAFSRSRSHLAYGGYLGQRYDPFLANHASRLPVYNDVGVDSGRISGANFFQLPVGVSPDRLTARQTLRESLDTLRRSLDYSTSIEGMNAFESQAMELLLGRRARDAFDLSLEDPRTRDRYGKHLWCQQALLARRLVEAGVAFVTIDLSYHPSSGTWDTHGDNIPPYGGIKNGLGPLLPLFDHLVTTLISDLEQRGKLDDVLVIAMGEFGRTPVMGTQGSTDGRNHWDPVMSMLLAGGGLRHGQVIGSTEADGGHIKERPVTPSDLAATLYRYMGVPLDATYQDGTGRPRAIVEENGQPIAELF